MPTFDEILDSDVNDIFLNKDFAREAVYTDSVGATFNITVQLFVQPLDATESLYTLIWCDAKEVPNIKKDDTFEVSGTTYGVVDYTVDEHNLGVDVFVNEV